MAFYNKILISFLGLICCLEPSDMSSKHLIGLYTGPYFSPHSVSNITVRVGETVHLPCRVRQVGTNTVAWVRNKDSSILAIDEDTIIQDSRFFVVKSEDREEWMLIIKTVSVADDGAYECQISTQVKMSHFVYLQVLVPTVTIEGAPDIFAKSGSSVDLSCKVTNNKVSASSLIWLKDEKVIPLADWPDVEVRMTEEEGHIVSVLTINNLSRERFGIYSCRPDGLSGQNVSLHVIDAKEQGLRTNSEQRVLNTRWTSVVILMFALFLIGNDLTSA